MAEANAILAAGMTIGAVYEDKPDAVSYFSSDRGRQDATNAFNIAVAMGQPAGSAIYFTVDYDAPSPDISGPVLDYFNGVNQGMQNASAGGIGAYSIGVYGSGDVCDFIKGQSGLAKYSWLTESTGWGGTKTYASWDVNQAIPTADLCGFTAANPQQYDENQALDDFGGFTSINPPIAS